jgi:hypothetical protein
MQDRLYEYKYLGPSGMHVLILFLEKLNNNFADVSSVPDISLYKIRLPRIATLLFTYVKRERESTTYYLFQCWSRIK